MKWKRTSIRNIYKECMFNYNNAFKIWIDGFIMQIKKRHLWNYILIMIIVIAIIGLVYINRSNGVEGNVVNERNNVLIGSEEQFVFEMIPHHQEAVDSAGIVFSETENKDIKKLAGNIIITQTQEINMLEGWKKDWYGGSRYRADYVETMPNLEELSGEQQDRAFIEGMIVHHQMAVEMAQQVLELKPRKEIADFARDVIRVQGNEIKEMQEMLK